MPAAPAVNEQELAGAPAVARPKSVDNAFLLWMIGAGIYLVFVIIGVSTDAARDSLERSLGRAPTDSEVTGAKAFALILGLLFIGLFVLFAFLMRAGRNWARITLTVLGGISIVLNLLGIGNADALSVIITLLLILLIAGSIYLMYRPDANRYFAPGAAQR